MQISISQISAIITWILSSLLVLFFGYFMYLIFVDGNKSVITTTSVDSINSGVFSGKIGQAASILKDKKINLKKKDLAFTETVLFNSFVDVPETVPLSESRGRPDPFVPYVAP